MGMADPLDSGPSGSQPPAPQPVPVPHAHQNHLESGPPVGGHGQITTGWTPPPTPQVAKARAIRRFWVSFMWAWLIWVAFGYVVFHDNDGFIADDRFIVGGGVADVGNEPMGRHGHWDKHGEWRGNAVAYSWFGYGNGEASS